MKEYECVLVDHHKKVAGVIQDYISKGWHLHTYQATGPSTGMGTVNHYLLFEKG